jgi:hypothetical protein
MSRIGRKSWLTAVTFALVLSVTGCAGGGDQATDAGYSAPSAPARRRRPPPPKPARSCRKAPVRRLRTCALLLPTCR